MGGGVGEGELGSFSLTLFGLQKENFDSCIPLLGLQENINL